MPPMSMKLAMLGDNRLEHPGGAGKARRQTGEPGVDDQRACTYSDAKPQVMDRINFDDPWHYARRIQTAA